MNWNIIDLLRFIKWHYLNWGGRVFYFFFYIIALRIGEDFIQVFQAIVFFFINFAIYKNCKRQDYDLTALFVVIFAWFSISISAIIDGVFWYTASSIYVWPFLAFFCSVFFSANKDKKRSYYIVAGILLFCAGFSQEQVAFFVIVYSLCKVVEAFIKDKKSLMIYFFGIIGSIVLLAAPGNWNRAEDNIEFYNLSIVEKILTNIPKIFWRNFNMEASPRMYIYIVLLCILGRKLFEKKAIVISHYVMSVLFALGVYKDKLVLEGIFVVCLAGEIVFYLIKTKKYECMYIFIGALATQAMLVVSPVVAPRTCLPFIIPMGYVAAVILLDSLDDGIVVEGAIAVFGVIAVVNICLVTKGYYSNYSEYTYDRKGLEAASQAIKDGKNIQSVKLKKLENDYYSGGMPYTIDYIKYWMKNYYEIPQSVEFVWV